MRWSAFFILLYLSIGLDWGLHDALRIHGAVPSLTFLSAVFMAIHAPRDVALLACFFLGFALDLFTSRPIGTSAFAFGVIALMLSGAQNAIYYDHPAARFLTALLAGVIWAIVAGLQGWVYSRLHPLNIASPDGEAVYAQPPGIWMMLLNGLYSAVVAPLFLGLLQRMRGLFAFERRLPTLALRGRSR